MMNAQTLPLLVFDLDGTLVDSLGDISACMNRTLVNRGYTPKPPEFYKTAVGDGVLTLLRRCIAPIQLDPLVEKYFLATYLKDYRSNLIVNTRPYAGITDLLDRLEKIGYPMAVFSNKPDDMTKSTVETLLPGRTFLRVQGQIIGEGKKPEPELTHALLKRLRFPPQNSIMIGDTSTDMLTASHAGMHSIGVTWGFRSEEELRAHQAEAIIHHPSEMESTLSSLFHRS